MNATFTLTAHAEWAATEREIAREWIERTLCEPEIVRPDLSSPALHHYLLPIAERDGRVLRVVVNDSVDPWSVVTVFFDRRERKVT